MKVASEIEIRQSSTDRVTKFIFRNLSPKNGPIEVVYVDNNTGKDIICLPTTVGCSLGCQFCFLTNNPKYDSSVISINTGQLMIDSVMSKDLFIHKNLLLSFMGMGEPMLNPYYVCQLYGYTNDKYKEVFNDIRYSLATIIPLGTNLWTLILEAEKVKKYPKVHWSLHSTNEELRKKIMPKASNIEESIRQLLLYKERTGSEVEIHYTIFDGNDSKKDAKALADIVKLTGFRLKFLRYRQSPTSSLKLSSIEHEFLGKVSDEGIMYEIYTPPGADILGACGQFEV